MELGVLGVLFLTAGSLQWTRPTQPQPQPVMAHGVAVPEAGGIFLSGNNSVVVASRGTDTTLDCTVARGSQYGMISWFRYLPPPSSGLLLLTVGDDTYCSDPRLAVVRPVLSMNWALQVQSVVPEDSGLYTCQSTGHPPISLLVTLTVTEARASILGSKEKVFRAGSTMQLVCTIHHLSQQPAYVFWYHNARMINYDSLSGVEVVVSPLAASTIRSTLTVARVDRTSSGNYSCQPSMVQEDTVWVQVKRLPAVPPEPVVNSASLHPPAQPATASLLLTLCSCLLSLMSPPHPSTATLLLTLYACLLTKPLC